MPWYLEQVGPSQTTDAILKGLCFDENGLLVKEYDRIFYDVFEKKGHVYQKVLRALKGEFKTQAEIKQAIQYSNSGTLSQVMSHLITAGFVTHNKLWSFKTKRALKQSLYRLSDPYMRFYFNVIEPKRHQIEQGAFQDRSLIQDASMLAHFGFQMEHLLIQNRLLFMQTLDIHPSDIVADGPYRQKQNSKQQGCQIDYLIQVSTQTLFLFEFKFKRLELGIDVAANVQEKIKRLKVPRGFSVVPVLCHVGGVSSELATSNYFYKIIDLGNFLINGK